MDSVENPPLSRLICPALRTKYDKDLLPRKKIGAKDYPVISNSYYFSNVDNSCSHSHHHHLQPLFWCNNKESKYVNRCGACHCQTTGTSYYFCNDCDKIYHKECVESPPVIKSPCHPKHHLQLIGSQNDEPFFDPISCSYCWARLDWSPFFFYYCFICNFSMDLVCARKPPFLNYQKRHEHTLNCFPRKASLRCDVCGRVDSRCLSYVCLECDFLVHTICIYLPFVIRISRHPHRITFEYSSPWGKGNLSCGVCRRKIDDKYGNYSCMKGCNYVAHANCATRMDVWDGKELDQEPEEQEDLNPSFEVVGDGTIKHFSHSHHLRFEKDDMLDDDNKICQACVLPLEHGGGVYKCTKSSSECDFLLHEECANLPRKKQHMAFPDPLILQATDPKSYFVCGFCRRYSCGFRYLRERGSQDISIEVRCAAISEPFDHQCHPHPLFLTDEPGSVRSCSMCARPEKCLNCIECFFALCFRCATLPYNVRHKKHDEHVLTLSYKPDLSLTWCELCEETINSPKWIYTCSDCGVTLHIECLFEKDAPSDDVWEVRDILLVQKINIIPNNRLTRPICNGCGKRCQYETIFQRCDGKIFCSFWEWCFSFIYDRPK